MDTKEQSKRGLIYTENHSQKKNQELQTIPKRKNYFRLANDTLQYFHARKIRIR